MNKLIAALAMVASVTAFAAIDDTSVVVSTKGPDAYADGTAVLQGELYALVWSAGDFAGIKADGTPVNENDKILKYGTATANANCGYFKYTLSAEDYAKGGYFSLYLLDTRVFAEESVTLAEKQDGAPTVVNQTSLVDAVVEVANAGSISGKTVGEFAATELPAGTESAKITGFEVKDGKAYIKIAASAYDRVDVASGDAPDAIAADGDAPKSGNGGVITIVKPATADKGFYQVIRK